MRLLKIMLAGFVLGLAVSGLLFQSLAGYGAWWSFAGALALSTALGAAGVVVANRIQPVALAR